jgi:hypothetical protein
VFFLTLAKDITGKGYGNYFFGSLFIIVAVLFLVDLFKNKMRFSLPAAGWLRYALLALSKISSKESFLLDNNLKRQAHYGSPLYHNIGCYLDGSCGMTYIPVLKTGKNERAN